MNLNAFQSFNSGITTEKSGIRFLGDVIYARLTDCILLEQAKIPELAEMAIKITSLVAGTKWEKKERDVLEFLGGVPGLGRSIDLIEGESINALELPLNIKNALTDGGFHKIKDLWYRESDDLMEVPGLCSPLRTLRIQLALSKAATSIWMRVKNGTQKILDNSEVPRELISNAILSTPLNDLNFSNRVKNHFKDTNVYYVGDLLSKTESEILSIPKLGMGSLENIKKVLSVHGLILGMKIENWIRPKSKEFN